MKVNVRISEIVLENEDGYDIPSIMTACSRCGTTTESFGQSDRSVRRCLVLLREGCPRNENNFYESGS